ncbi:MAG: CDP-glucose 4,6-dehydratase [Chitinophagales bacterium]|nr:CDP-glucose 4,6-dehydratase [Chitinophagales bacterium]
MENRIQKYKNYFQGKRVLITGNTGFKGSWLTLFILQLGSKVFGISNEHHNNDILFKSSNIKENIQQYYLDINDLKSLKEAINEIQPDVVFHLAAQSITLEAYKNPIETFRVNALGLANLLECFRNYKKKCDLIIITSDKCYKNNEWVWGYRENDILAGEDPYSASKSIAEIIFNSYYQTYFKYQDDVQMVSCRAGNVIGGGDWSTGRIVPDCMRAWKNKKTLEIRSPKSIRPWNDILDVIYGYTICASLIREKSLNGESFNIGPQQNKELTVLELINGVWENWPEKDFLHFSVTEDNQVVENAFLKLNTDKIEHTLNWKPQTDTKEMFKRTAKWYWEFQQRPNEIRNYTDNIISDFISNL